jgi:hypothetical protein
MPTRRTTRRRDEKKSGTIAQIVVGVAIALLAGGSSPWWWSKIFPLHSASGSDPIVGRWKWGADSTGPRARTQWVTVNVDGTLESTISDPQQQPPEQVNDSGKWTVLDKDARRYEFDWNALGGGSVWKNFLTLSPDGQRLLENDKGKQIVRQRY